MKTARHYKGTSQEAARQDNPTLDFFIKFVGGNNQEFEDTQRELVDFLTEGYEAEGRDLTLAVPNALGFLFVLETSGRKPEHKHIFDAEASIANFNISDEDVSRYAWGFATH